MPSLRRGPKEECTLINQDPNSGIKTFVCRTDPDTVFEVKVDKEGNIMPDLKYKMMDPKEYDKIHKALRKHQSQTPMV